MVATLNVKELFANSVSSKMTGFANTVPGQGLPDHNAVALKAGLSSLAGSRVPCHPQDGSQLPLSQAAVTACSHTENELG
jgi:hypothetical protein